jgi:hypothetical protein
MQLLVVNTFSWALEQYFSSRIFHYRVDVGKCKYLKCGPRSKYQGAMQSRAMFSRLLLLLLLFPCLALPTIVPHRWSLRSAVPANKFTGQQIYGATNFPGQQIYGASNKCAGQQITYGAANLQASNLWHVSARAPRFIN